MDEKSKYAALNEWFRSEQGRSVVDEFKIQLQHTEAKLSGKNVLHLGFWVDSDDLKSLNYQHQFFYTPTAAKRNRFVMGSIHDLPFERGSIDCIVAPLAVEASSHKIQLIDELDRVLSPMGHLVFMGINPLSFWGLSSCIKTLPCFGRAHVKLRSAMWLKNKLNLRGYQLCDLKSFYFIPPLMHEYWIKRLEFLNQMGKMIWPFPAGFYCLVVQKREIIDNSILYQPFKTRRLSDLPLSASGGMAAGCR